MDDLLSKRFEREGGRERRRGDERRGTSVRVSEGHEEIANVRTTELREKAVRQRRGPESEVSSEQALSTPHSNWICAPYLVQ
eukprot:4249380-Pleurochrysis_carterae.AAC.3